jgi:phosphate transport system substrate-binding protein
MNEQNYKSARRWTKLSIATALLLAIGWSLGSIGRGIWQLSDKSVISPSQTDLDRVDSFDRVANVATGVFNYGGSPAWSLIRLVVDSEIQAERSEFRLRYIQSDLEAPGSGTGVRMLIDGQLAFAQSSRPLLVEEYQLAAAKGIQLKQIPVAVDGIAVAVNPSLNVPGLTLEQLAGIYSGKIVNWSEVGGPNLAIIPYSLPISSGELFSENVLKGENFGANVRFSPTTTQVLRELAEIPGAIYYASAPVIASQCKIKLLPIADRSGEYISPYQTDYIPPEQCPKRRNQLNFSAFQTARYPLTRYLYVMIAQNGGLEEQAGRTYANFLLTDRGQKLIVQAGFIPVP